MYIFYMLFTESSAKQIYIKSTCALTSYNHTFSLHCVNVWDSQS